MKFKKEELQDLLWGDHDDDWEIIEDKIIETSRWSILHDLIFKYEGRFYATDYSEGATEQQDEQPFEHDENEIECDEVWPYETTVIKYSRIRNEEE